ncbi:MAG: oligoendopeptidase F [Bdellovibrionales bacterium]|nr:oligoendopeptidase F [Bdellovibrionales bacterium]
MIERKDVPASDTWNYQALYSNEAEWEAAFKALEAKSDTISSYKGRLGESADTLAEAFDLHYGQHRELDKIYTYTKLLSDVDISNSENLGRVQRATNLASKLSAASSFLRPELFEIPVDTLKQFMNAPKLAPYRHTLEALIRHRPHTLSNDEERLLVMAAQALSSPDKIYTQLANADMQFGTVQAGGKEHILTHGSYGVLIKNQDRAVRKDTQTKYYAQYEQFKNSTAAALTGSYQKDVFYTRARKFDSCLERGLFDDNIPTEVYTNLVDTISKNLDSLHRYYSVRKRLLGLEDQRLYDTYVPLVAEVDLTINYEEAVDYMCDALAPLGEEYTNILRRGLLDERWVDRYENKGKRSGAYSGGCYDSYPYILVSYKQDDIRSMFTLAHEAGHSMHSYYAHRAQPYHYSAYSIFVAEVASTFNEALLSAHLQEKFKDDKSVLIYLINQQIDDIKATMHRQTMFAEFELEAHKVIEQDLPLTVDVFSSIYEKLLTKYFGSSVIIEGNDRLEYSRIPHFYWSFYVYKYATGISAAIALADRVCSGGTAEREDYLNFLRAGSSQYPLEILKDAGVDMASPEPVEKTCQLFSQLVDKLETLIDA